MDPETKSLTRVRPNALAHGNMKELFVKRVRASDELTTVLANSVLYCIETPSLLADDGVVAVSRGQSPHHLCTFFKDLSPRCCVDVAHPSSLVLVGLEGGERAHVTHVWMWNGRLESTAAFLR